MDLIPGKTPERSQRSGSDRRIADAAVRSLEAGEPVEAVGWDKGPERNGVVDDEMSQVAVA